MVVVVKFEKNTRYGGTAEMISTSGEYERKNCYKWLYIYHFFFYCHVHGTNGWSTTLWL